MYISIIIPIYNAEKYLRACLDSVINQAGQDYEVILIDDGCVDNSSKIYSEYCKNYPKKLKVHRQENKGPLLARRSGVEKAKGDYIIFVDADDYIHCDMLKTIKEIILKYDCDLVVYEANKVLGDSKIIPPQPLFENEGVFDGKKKIDVYRLALIGSTLNSICAKAIKRSILVACYDLDGYGFVRENEDVLQMLSILSKAKRIAYTPVNMYYYRYNPQSSSQTFSKSKYVSIRAVGMKLYEYITLWELGEDIRVMLHERNLDVTMSIILQIGHVNCSWNKTQKIEFLTKVADDSFFLEAYTYCKKSNLRLAYRMLCELMFRRHFITIMWISNLTYMLNLRGLKYWYRYLKNHTSFI